MSPSTSYLLWSKGSQKRALLVLLLATLVVHNYAFAQSSWYTETTIRRIAAIALVVYLAIIGITLWSIACPCS